MTGTVEYIPPIGSASDQNVNLDKVGGAAITLGQKTSAASLPVVIASDQSAIPVSGTLTAQTSANATAAAPSYSEGTENPLSQNLTGDLRTIAKVASGQTIAVTNVTATNLNAAVVGTGTAGTPAGNLLTVQGAASMTPVLTSTAPVSTAALGIVPVVSSALETGHVIKASAGNLYSLSVTTTTVGGFVQVLNSTTVPAAGAVTPIDVFSVPANSTVIVGYDPPLVCSTGISAAFSIAATPFTKTDSATAYFSGKAV